jgi:hypothetical protein
MFGNGAIESATRSKHVLCCSFIEAEFVLNCTTTKKLGYDAVVSHKEPYTSFFYNQSAIRLVKNLNSVSVLNRSPCSIITFK